MKTAPSYGGIMPVIKTMALDNIIHLEGVSVFQNHTMVINDVSLEINRGEFVYLIGKTGSGKSSLLKTIYGELPLNHGTGTVAGFNLNELKSKDVPFLRRKLGIVFQDFQLLGDRSVNENLRFVMKATGWKDETQIQQRITDVLTKVGLSN
ncbi:MAG: cell division ATP-binding protein FtsE, partial [Bacteroidia bacterium]